MSDSQDAGGKPGVRSLARSKRRKVSGPHRSSLANPTGRNWNRIALAGARIGLLLALIRSGSVTERELGFAFWILVAWLAAMAAEGIHPCEGVEHAGLTTLRCTVSPPLPGGDKTGPLCAVSAGRLAPRLAAGNCVCAYKTHWLQGNVHQADDHSV